ncbi:MAG: hypothetical protein HRU08_01840, partial [Oleispira sp.]|nr:hypothetical protein [Oleispira sp.]
MKTIRRFQKKFKAAVLIIAAAMLSACGSDSESTIDLADATDLCAQNVSGVNWQALLTETCPNLSDYNLFIDASDPTSGPNEKGIPFALSTPLFTDYATKYRFVFVPEGKVATYSADEVIEFPVGSVLVKTFSIPEDTANRGVNETNIETRLLIHRVDGWTAIPYYWDSATDASYIITGKTISDITITHNGEALTFDYGV